MNPKQPPQEEQDRLVKLGFDLAREFIPRLGVPEAQYETALKAYVAGFIAGNGAAKGEAASKLKMN